MGQTINKQSWWQLLSIQAAGAICLPVILVGQILCQKYEWHTAVVSVVVGNLFLLAVGYFFALLSVEKPLSTVEHIACYGGRYARKLCAAVMLFSMLGWFGIQLNIMSMSLEQLLEGMGVFLPPSFLHLGMGIVLSAILCLGIRAMASLANFITPLLALTVLYAIFSSHGSCAKAAVLTPFCFASLLSVIGVNIAVVIDLPTFLRHAKSSKDARICVVLLYGVVVPLIEGAGIYLSTVTGTDSVLGALQSGHGVSWMMWVSCFVLLSGWVTNNANLYSALTSSYALWTKGTVVMRSMVLGAIGTFIACLNPLENIEGILRVFTIVTLGMGAVILCGYLLEKFNNEAIDNQ